MGRSSRRKMRQQKNTSCGCGDCHGHFRQPPADEGDAATVANGPAAAPTTSSTGHIAERTKSRVSGPNATPQPTESVLERVPPVAAPTASSVSGPNAPPQPTESVLERVPPIASKGQLRITNNKPKAEAETSVEVKNMNSDVMGQLQWRVNPVASNTKNTTQGKSRGLSAEALLEIREGDARKIVNFFCNFLQFTVDFDENIVHAPMTLFGRSFMKDMLVTSKILVPVLESLKKMWSISSGLNAEGCCSLKRAEMFLKWRKFGLLLRQSMTLRRKWEDHVLRFGLTDCDALRKALINIDRSINEISNLLEMNKDCDDRMKHFLMQRPDLLMPAVFTFEETPLWKRDQWKKVKEILKKREASQSGAVDERVKLRIRRNVEADSNDQNYNSHAGDTGRKVCPVASGNQTWLPSYDDIFDRTFRGMVNNRYSQMVDAVEKLIDNSSGTYDPLKTREFFIFSRRVCMIIEKQLFAKVSP